MSAIRQSPHRRLAIVPAYNESGSVAAVVRDVMTHAHGFDVLVVDDGSTDATTATALQAGAKVIRLPFNLGIGGAMQAGYLYASEQGYEVAIQVDGDGQHDARHIPELLAHLVKNPQLDMVTGSRFVSADAHGYRSSASRRVGIRIFARVISAITGSTVTDPTSGFRMTTRRGIELFAHDYPHDYPEVEAILMMHAHQLQSAELSVTMRSRTTGVSSINPTRSAYYMVKVLVAIFIGLFRARPNVKFGDPAPVTAQSSL
ncbi:MAG: glycosyl transferase family 2 [Conexibacter sp.]|jgi:glycosyltransferase involved in cell wall biosynthesis|nr:glycosyl transferase family 2 [Conexibacter sp.]